MRNAFAAAVAAAGLFLLAFTAPAYERELTSYQIREAVFLGRDASGRTVEFLRGYMQTFPASKSGVYLARAEVSTLYKQIVDRTRRDIGGSYTPQDAQRDFGRGPSRLLLDLTFLRLLTASPYLPTTPALPGSLSPLDLLDGFRYAVFQNCRELRAPIQVINGIYDCGDFGCFLIGAQVQLALEVFDVESAGLDLEVIAPDSRVTRASFELARLR